MDLRTHDAERTALRGLVVFYLLAFAVSWAGRVPLALDAAGRISLPPALVAPAFLLGGGAPTIAAVVALVVTGDRQGLLAGLKRWRFGARWWLAALGIPMLVTVAAGILDSPGTWPQTATLTALPLIFATMVVSYVWEEVGWRGYALPRMERFMPALAAAGVMGILAFGWHLPLLLNPSVPGGSFIEAFVFSVAFAVIVTWLFDNTGGSLVAATAFHAAFNTMAAYQLDVFGEAGFARQHLTVVLITALVAIVVAVRYGPGLVRDAAGS